MRFSKVFLCCIAFSPVAICRAQQSDVRGVVFVDRNGNGAHDAGERALGGVMISNQDAIVVSDSAGAFHLPRGANGIVFVSVPDGYRSVGAFWRHVGDGAAPVAFALAPVPKTTMFTFVHASDTHIAPASLERTKRLRSLVDDTAYYGHVDSLQLAWLERDLAHVPAAMPIVTFNHIPLVSAHNDLAGYTEDPPAPTLLRAHRHVLALGAHIHIAERIVYEVEGVRTRFEQSAAVVGPSRMAGRRFPSGITVYTVRGGEIDAGRFVPLGLPLQP
ncbi:MAG: hypothetical protein M3081_18465 [Gemmatimonadota bacterium]|nr:hypothetical protein [Gemmatimonadota bacterium]